MSRSAIPRRLAAALLAPAGCFYTTPINERPHAEITADPGPHFPGQLVSLSAAGSSDSEDGISLTCTWNGASCLDPTCARTQVLPEQEGTRLPCAQPFRLAVPPQDHRSIRVELIVQDQDGASYTAWRIVEVGNRRPDVQVQVRPAGISHSVVSLPVEASALVDDPDGDDVSLTWRLLKPPGAGAEVALVEVSDLVQTFTPDIPGLWGVEVTGDDGIEPGSGDADIAVDEDGPPCIALTSPPAGDARLVLRREDGPRAFAALRIADDLDPFPRPSVPLPFLGEASFTWQLASPDTGGERVPVAGADASELTIDPSVYAPGDLLDIRVEVADRVIRPLPCDDDAPSCALGGVDCHQRLSWRVEIR